MDYSNGQYTYPRGNESGNAILHGSFDHERHGTGNGSTPDPLQNTPHGTRPQLSEANAAYLQGRIANTNPQMLAPPLHQSTFKIPQTWGHGTNHSATQANGGFGSAYGGSPYDQRTTVGYGGSAPGGIQSPQQIGGFAALAQASQSQHYSTAQDNLVGAASFTRANGQNYLARGSPVQPGGSTASSARYPNYDMRTVAGQQLHQHQHFHQGGVQPMAGAMEQQQARFAPPSQWSGSNAGSTYSPYQPDAPVSFANSMQGAPDHHRSSYGAYQHTQQDNKCINSGQSPAQNWPSMEARRQETAASAHGMQASFDAAMHQASHGQPMRGSFSHETCGSTQPGMERTDTANAPGMHSGADAGLDQASHGQSASVKRRTKRNKLKFAASGQGDGGGKDVTPLFIKEMKEAQGDGGDGDEKQDEKPEQGGSSPSRPSGQPDDDDDDDDDDSDDDDSGDDDRPGDDDTTRRKKAKARRQAARQWKKGLEAAAAVLLPVA